MLRSLLPLLLLHLLALVLGESAPQMNPASKAAEDAYSTQAHPGAKPLDVNGYPVAPSGLELEQVHVYVRHGVSRFPALSEG